MSITKRRLVIKSFHMNRVELGDNFRIKDNTLTIGSEYFKNCSYNKDIIKQIDIDIIKPNQHDKHVNNILDFIPISVKCLGNLGEGITHTLTGVYVMLTCASEAGEQMSEFGSSDGNLKEQVYFGRSGTPSANDYILHFDVLLKGNLLGERRFPMQAHKSCDNFIQEIRYKLKQLDSKYADEVHEYVENKASTNKKIVIVKQVAGQGAMHDNIILPNEPSGVTGGKSIIDMGNVPIILSPNEYRDGAIRAMT
ncbi:proline reductase cluster protein PrdD [Clostridiaceae bacterium M8S5]|nr:proline reductase cluster protein PrdD [Clostridiaceae bacterium M8S5]